MSDLTRFRSKAVAYARLYADLMLQYNALDQIGTPETLLARKIIKEEMDDAILMMQINRHQYEQASAAAIKERESL